MYTVMFWNHNEAILFGHASQFTFDTREAAEAFIDYVQVDNCTDVSINDEFYSVKKEVGA